MQHEHDADGPLAALHHDKRHGTAAHLLDERPEDMTHVERQERKQV